MAEKQFVISLSNLHKKKRFSAMAGETVLDYCLFEIVYKVIGTVPLYELRFPEESTIMDVCSNNAVDIVEAANEYFDVRLTP
jgi:hypothetical protein